MEHKEKSIEETREENLASFLAFFESRNPENFKKLIAKKFTFLPTMSGELVLDIDGAIEYFSKFLLNNPKPKIVEGDFTMMGDSGYFHTGLYDFELGPDDNRYTVNARFTLVWVMENGEWKITHFHSSEKPAKH